MKDQEKNHAVRYDQFGHSDVLYIAEMPKPEPKANQVLVKVKAAGINPGEAGIREGKMEKEFPSHLPQGQGSDFAGVVEAVGDGVDQFKEGDEVIGFSNDRNAQAEYVAVNADQLVSRPENVSWEEGGGLFVVGATAYATVKAVGLKAKDIVIVSGAAGGVGTLVVQIAKNKGAKVIGLASENHHAWLEKHGIVPVSYEGDVQANLEKALAGEKATAFIDTSGKGYVELAVNMGIPTDRIDTIIDFEGAQKFKVKADGMSKAATPEVLAELVTMLDKGELEIPVAKTYPLNQVREAYDDLEQRHTLGKIVLIASAN